MSAILEDVKPETAAKIAAQARMRGLSIDEYLRSLLPDERDQSEQNAMSPAQKAQLWRQWIADDSRESIYTREDEAL